MADLHVMFLKNRDSITSRGWLELVDQGVLRAAFSPVNGPWRVGLGTYTALSGEWPAGDPEDPQVSGDRPITVEEAYRIVCPSDTKPPCDLVLLQVVRGVVSMLAARPYIAFALLTLDSGKAARWAAETSALEDVQGAEVATALAFGSAGVDAVVEVVADDLGTMEDRVRTFTEIDGVLTSQVLFVAGDRTRGFGLGPSEA